MKQRHLYRLCITCLLAACALAALPAAADDVEHERFEAVETQGVVAYRSGSMLILNLDAGVKDKLTIPRLAAPLRSMYWIGFEGEADLKLKPEPDTWGISWKARPEGDAALVLEFDGEPRVIEEVKPIQPAGDGSFYLPAHLAKTVGEKIRYEPQPYKNTVGYWTGKQDSATWSIQLDEPGRFNVAVLQGCGKGQGGSVATFSLISTEQDVTPALEYEVIETGHFQNFQWLQVGEVELKHAGTVKLEVLPKTIKKAALMDIRAIHLIRLPDKK